MLEIFKKSGSVYKGVITVSYFRPLDQYYILSIYTKKGEVSLEDYGFIEDYFYSLDDLKKKNFYIKILHTVE
jgi:hypothetical protein